MQNVLKLEQPCAILAAFLAVIQMRYRELRDVGHHRGAVKFERSGIQFVGSANVDVTSCDAGITLHEPFIRNARSKTSPKPASFWTLS